LVGSPVAINNNVPASQTRFSQFCVIERFCVESMTSAVIVGHSSKDLHIIHWPYF